MAGDGLFQGLRRTLVGVERALLSDQPGPLEAFIQSGYKADEHGDYCPRCGKGVGPHEIKEDRCAACHNQRLPWGGFVRLGTYDGPLREAIHDFKFNRWHTVGEHLGRALGAAVAERLRLVARQAQEPESAVLNRSVVVPVPMSAWRRSSRGIDHASVLAGAVASGAGLPMRRLLRRRHRPAQTGLSGPARRKNLKGAMIAAGDTSGLDHVRVFVLVDDVSTTGSTLMEACRALRGIPNINQTARVLVACVGVTDPRRRPSSGSEGLMQPIVEVPGGVLAEKN